MVACPGPVTHEEPKLSNIASLLKEEIARLVRKQLRSEVESLKKVSSRYRFEIAALKRRIEALEKQVCRVGRMIQSTPRLPFTRNPK